MRALIVAILLFLTPATVSHPKHKHPWLTNHGGGTCGNGVVEAGTAVMVAEWIRAGRLNGFW